MGVNKLPLGTRANASDIFENQNGPICDALVSLSDIGTTWLTYKTPSVSNEAYQYTNIIGGFRITANSIYEDVTKSK